MDWGDLPMDPLVSIIMPAYNAAATIGASIRGILGQTYENFELIVVDDGSQDNTAAIIRSFSDSRIRLIENPRNLKIARSLNIAIDAAKGKYLARSDADDINMPNRLEIQVNYMETHPEVDVVGSSMYLFNDSGNIIGGLINKKTEHQDMVQHIHWFAPPLCHPTIMARAEWLRRYRYGEQYFPGEDGDLFLRSYRQSKFANLPMFLYAWRDPGKFLPKKLVFSNWKATLMRWQNWREYGIPPQRVLIYPLLALGRVLYHVLIYILGRSQMWVHRTPLKVTESLRLDQQWLWQCLEDG